MNNIKNITCEDFEDQIEYIFYQLQEQEDVTLICDREIAKEISNFYDEEDFEDFYSIEICTEEDIYIIGKIKDEVFSIEPAYNKGKLLGFDDVGLVIVQKELFKEDIEEHVDDFKNVLVIGLEEECNCNECTCGCSNGSYIKDNTHDEDKDFENDDLQDVKEFLDLKFEEYKDDPDMSIDELLLEIYRVSFNDGFNSALLSMRNRIDEVLEE